MSSSSRGRHVQALTALVQHVRRSEQKRTKGSPVGTLCTRTAQATKQEHRTSVLPEARSMRVTPLRANALGLFGGRGEMAMSSAVVDARVPCFSACCSPFVCRLTGLQVITWRGNPSQSGGPWSSCHGRDWAEDKGSAMLVEVEASRGQASPTCSRSD